MDADMWCDLCIVSDSSLPEIFIVSDDVAQREITHFIPNSRQTLQTTDYRFTKVGC